MREPVKKMRGCTEQECDAFLRACDRVWNAVGYDLLATDQRMSNASVVEYLLDGGCFDMYADLDAALLERWHSVKYATRVRWLKGQRRYN